MRSLRSPAEVLAVSDVTVTRDGARWVFTHHIFDVNSVWTDEYPCTADELRAAGPPAHLSAEALDAMARDLGLDPATVPWCRERRLLERVVADDLAGTQAALADSPTPPASLLTIALGVAAWSVATELLRRGAPLAAPERTTWEAASYAVAVLDGSPGSLAVLAALLARGAIHPTGRLLRHVRAPAVVPALVAAGADPDGRGRDGTTPSPELDPMLVDATPLAIAVVHRDEHGPDRLAVAEALLACGAAIEARDVHGRTALIVAARWGNPEPVRWLLAHGADLRCAPDAERRTPRSLALARPDDPSSSIILAALGATPRRRRDP